MCVRVVHHHFRFLDGVSGGQSFFGADFVESDEHGGIDGTRDVEESARDALHAHDATFFKFRCGCGIWIVLDFGEIRR